MEHVPFIIKNTSQKVIEFNFSNYVYHPNDYATWRFSADRDTSSIDWEAIKDYEDINTINAPAKTFRLMPGEAISLRNVSKVGTVCNPHFNIKDKGLSFDGSLLSLLPDGKMTKECFKETFSECFGLTETPSFSDITEVPQDAFMYMFAGCENLEKASEIAATKFDNLACEGMFAGCTSLKNAADTPNAKKLGVGAFERMYYGCKSLTEMAACPNVDIIPDGCFCKTYANSGITEMKPLPASRVERGAYESMFKGCTNLEKASEIAATEFGEEACKDMFNGCTSLKKPANMPNAKKLDMFAFVRMYYGCKSLTEMADYPNVDIIPDCCFNETYAETGIKEMKPLPASIVGVGAYNSMFKGCINLEKASEIAAKEFGKSACWSMFEGCTSLKNAANIPNAKELDTYAFLRMYYGCKSLTEMAACPNVDIIPEGCFCETYAYSGIKGMMKPLPASKVGRFAYDSMFKGCTNLEKTSEIAATEFGEEACKDMFKGCKSLKNAANIPNAKKLSERAFSGMYYGCKSLTEMPDCPNVDIIPEGCFCKTYAYSGIKEMKKPLPASKVEKYAYAGMFEGCTNLENASEIAAKEFGEGACDRMFKDCTSLKKPANMPNCQNTFKDMYAGCPLQPVTKKSKTKGSKAKLKHPILRQGKAKGQSKGLK